jgi:hypothetical protein
MSGRLGRWEVESLDVTEVERDTRQVPAAASSFVFDSDPTVLLPAAVMS